MATEANSVVATAPATVTADSPARGGRGGGRGRGRGGGRGRGRGEGSQYDHGNGGNENRQGQRGRGAGFRGAAAPHGGRPGNTASVQNPSLGADGKAAGSKAGKTIAEGADESEAEVCFICASPVMHEAIYPCNHRTCHICSLRMRALYKDKNCVHCRVCCQSITFIWELNSSRQAQ